MFLKSSIIFQVNESLFPCKLSSANTKLAEEAVELAVKTWGKRSLTELEAEERLSYSCEKVKFIDHTDFHLIVSRIRWLGNCMGGFVHNFQSRNCPSGLPNINGFICNL